MNTYCMKMLFIIIGETYTKCIFNTSINASLFYIDAQDIMKLSQQIQFSYSTNRRAENPLQLHICGLTGQIKNRLNRIGDYKNWDVSHFHL